MGVIQGTAAPGADLSGAGTEAGALMQAVRRAFNLFVVLGTQLASLKSVECLQVKIHILAFQHVTLSFSARTGYLNIPTRLIRRESMHTGLFLPFRKSQSQSVHVVWQCLRKAGDRHHIRDAVLVYGLSGVPDFVRSSISSISATSIHGAVSLGF